MCIMSMVHDHFKPMIPSPQPWTPSPLVTPPSPVPWVPMIDEATLRKILADFAEAQKAATVVDKLTGQPDCLDPEKATLIERVRELERRLAEIEKRVG